MADIELDLIADTRDAVKSVKSFASSTQKSLQGIESSFSTLRTVALGAVGFLAGRQLIRSLEVVTEAASIQEDAIKQLNTALELSGDFSEVASKQFQDFASDLQSVSTVGDEVTLQQLALAKSFGTTNKQAQDLVEAAVDLSAATGISLDSAVRNLGKTFGGLTGELGEVVPALKNLTKEQLETGAAVDFVANRFGGAAEALTDTFSGAVKQATNIFGDFQEELGFLITQNPAIIATVKAVGETFSELGGVIAANRGEIVGNFTEGFISGLRSVIDFIPTFAQAIQVTLVGTINGAKIAFNLLRNAAEGLALGFVSVQKVVLQARLAFNKLFGSADEVASLQKSIEETAQVQEMFVDSITKTTNEMGALKDGIVDSFDPAIPQPFQEALDGLSGRLAKIADAAKEAGQQAKQALTITPEVEGGFLDKLVSFDFAGAGKDLSEGLSGALSSISEGLFGGDEGGKTAKQDSGIGESISEGFSLAASGLTSALDGSFINFIGGFIKSFGELPGILLEAFKGLDQVLIKFIDAFPELVEKLIDAVPALVQGIVEAVPIIVDQFVKEFPRIVALLTDALIDIVDVLLAELPKIIDALPEILNEFLSRLPALLETILQRLPAIIESIFRVLPQIVRQIAAVLPDLVLVIADNIGPIVIALVEGIVTAIPEIIIALVDELVVKGGAFRIAFAIVRVMVAELPVALVQGIARAAQGLFSRFGKEMLSGFGSGVPNLGKVFGGSFSSSIKLPKLDLKELRNLFSPTGNPLFQGLKKLFGNPPFLDKLQQVLDSFDPGKIFGGGGGGGGPLGGVGKALGFQSGGVVPQGFPNDSFPAALTSGELIVPTDLVSELGSFLRRERQSGGSGGGDISQLIDLINSSSEQNVNINLQISEAELANVNLNLNRQGFRVA